ncbi:bifunctional transcriptional activator/DNA repair enzyme AdaA [Chitinibacter tainanensis]|uniref:bifunctional transcriptional activator/DNA repair enzyme AdaA n=1 Tax=Chitinibacter tainanensis TaxID=230667 RepID=UPI0003FFADBC|nr:methylated-DNA--[protein]-cysteine S-methyltransferase [Chitinibacter tainanensis]
MSDFQRVAQAMQYLAAHAHEQPSLAAVASAVHLSPFHFQRLFCRWAGTTPKRFLQALTLERGKALLDQSASVLETAHVLGLSGGSRLHDHFVQLAAVTPGEYKSRGAGLVIEYGLHATPVGPLWLAQTPRGVCRAELLDFHSPATLLAELQQAWPLSTIRENPAATAPVVATMFGAADAAAAGPVSLHVAGTNFQLAVWRALLNIPPAALTSYGQIAAAVGRPTAARAVGNAIGANPVALLIPCHRVIQQSGALGGYRWGLGKKLMIQTWEQLQAAPVL